MKNEKIKIIIFFLIQNIIHNMGHPITPGLVKSLGIPDYMFGVFFATMAFGLMIGGPIWGALGDKGKKKKYIIIGLLTYSVGQFFFGYSGNQYLMVFFRLLSGFGVVSSITLLTSYLIEITSKDKRAKYLALLGAAVTLGASIGYYFGGFIAENAFTHDLFHITNNKEIFLIQALLNIGYVGLIIIFFKDKTTYIHDNNKIKLFDSFKYIKQLDFKLLVFLISLTFISMGQINLNKFIDVYFIDLAYNPLELGTFKMVTGIVTLFGSIVLVPLLAKLTKQIGFLILIRILSAIIVFYTFRSNNFILTVYTVFMIYILIKAVYTPLEQNYISSHAKVGEYGKIIGIRQSFLSIGMVLGPLLGGFIYNIKPLWLFDSSAIFFVIGVILLLYIFILDGKKGYKKVEYIK